MMAYTVTNIIVAMTFLTLVLGQRPFFAGSRPIGYPDRVKPAADELGNRFGDGDNSTTTQKLPLEALGNRELVDRLSKLPVDKQPFWLINWQALENHRKNPQTYPQRPSPFLESAMPVQISENENSNSQNSNLQNRFSAPANVNDSGVLNDFNSGNVNQTSASSFNEGDVNGTNHRPENSNIDNERISIHPPNPNLNKKASSTTDHHVSGYHQRPSATSKPNTSKATSISPDSGLTHALPDFYDDLDIDLHNGHLNTDIKKRQKLQQQNAHAQSNVPLSIYDLYF